MQALYNDFINFDLRIGSILDAAGFLEIERTEQKVLFVWRQ